MALIYEADLKRQIKEKNMLNCYLFYGSEEYLKQFYTEKICKTFVTPGSETFSLRKYDGKENTLDDVLEGASSMPFMSEYCVVIARDFPLDALNNDDKNKFTEYLENQPDTSITIFWMDSIEVSPKNAKWKWDIDNFNKILCVCRCVIICQNFTCNKDFSKTITPLSFAFVSSTCHFCCPKKFAAELPISKVSTTS